MTGQSRDAGATAPHDAPTHPLDPWGLWIIRWLGAMLTISMLGITLLLALDWSGWSVGWMVVFAVPIAFIAAVLTWVAAALRWMLSRFAPPPLQDALVLVVGLGVLGAVVPLWLWLFHSGSDANAYTARALRVTLGGMIAPAGLGGGVASYLAERQISVRRVRWWMATVGTALAGALVSTAALSFG